MWGVILAGGEGQRLRGFLRSVHGTERPKQFCAIIGTRSMLRHTVERVNQLIPPERTVTVVTAGHRPFVAEDLVAEAPRILLEQPANRDTAPGILLPLAAILRRNPTARVALFPSDHFILEEDQSMALVRLAAAIVRALPERILLLGIAPDRIAPPLARARGARPSQRAVGTAITDGFMIHTGRKALIHRAEAVEPRKVARGFSPCPFLEPARADWIYPVAGYCRGVRQGRLMVPSVEEAARIIISGGSVRTSGRPLRATAIAAQTESTAPVG